MPTLSTTPLFSTMHSGSAANDLCVCDNTDIDVTLELPGLEDTQVRGNIGTDHTPEEKCPLLDRENV